MQFQRVAYANCKTRVMDAPANSIAEKQNDQRRVDQQDILYCVILFLAAVTFGLFSRVLGAHNAPFRPIMGKRGESDPATGAADGDAAAGGSSADTATTPVAASGTSRRRASAVRQRVGASPRSRSAASNAGSRTWIPWLALLWPMPNSRPWTTCRV